MRGAVHNGVVHIVVDVHALNVVYIYISNGRSAHEGSPTFHGLLQRIKGRSLGHFLGARGLPLVKIL